jgi:carbamoyl-phosphate synthase large subunit
METGLTGLNEIEIKGAPDKSAIVGALARPTPDRILVIAQAIRYGLTVEEIAQASKYEPWFIRQIEELVGIEEKLRKDGLPKEAKPFFDLKKKGFSDERLGELTKQSAGDVATKRRALGVRPVFKRIDTCAAEFESHTPYLYSCYEGDGVRPAECEAQPTDRRKIIILGGGPNRIGQGIEFDYCCVHAVYALREAGYETIMVNCNPETVSTDYDTADRLYFEPLTAEDVIELVDVERRNGELLGLIVQFGGQTPLKLAKPLEAAGIPILGTSPDAIDLAEDRERFQQLIQKLKLRQPENGTATSQEKAIEIAEKIGYPVVIRPSYVLGGRAMQIVYDRAAIERYMRDAVKVSGSNPVLIDSYLRDAIEVDVDALADKDQNVFVAGIMEHIEEAGIHSGDSACSLPPYSLSAKILAEIERQTEAMAKALNVVGLMNVQFAVKDGDVYVLEVNPRASRTVPFVAKATGQPIAKFAARLMAGEALKSLGIKKSRGKHIAVKEAVFPFARFPGVDIILGPEMRSTGEVMGLDMDFGRAFAKSQLGAGSKVPVEGAVFVSVKDQDKPAMVKPLKRLIELGFKVVATRGTAEFLRKHGIEAQQVNKVLEGRPHIVDLMKDGKVHLVFNTVDGASALTDSFTLRRTALMNKIAYYTTVAGAKASVEGIAAVKEGGLDVAPLQSYFKTSF